MKLRTSALACAIALTASLALPATAQSPARQSGELRELANALFAPIPASFKEVRGQPITAEQIELGQWLFFDPRLSRSHVISCNTCHNVGTGGADNVPVSIGHGWQKGPRNSPTVLNAVLNAAQFWDGCAADLKEQAKGPVQASVEMNSTPERVEATLRSMPGYVQAFGRAFPGQRDPVTFDNMAAAIEAFEAQRLTAGSRVDRFLAGQDSLDAAELQGLSLFIDKGCIACHAGANFGGQAYFPFGVVERPGADVLPPTDKGRFTVTQTASDEYVFRAAPLRNIALTAPYFHSGQVWDLEQAVAIMGNAQLGHELDAGEVQAITRFLRTLTGTQPRIQHPVLPTSTLDTPRPE